MKKACQLLMATVLVVALAQCKKEQQSISEEEHEVRISLVVNSNGTRLDVTPPHITFENGDVIYVASDGKYIGTLTYNEGQFSGTITDPVEGKPLHFYFLGNRNPGTLTVGTSTACYVSISDQTKSLPVISYAPSDEDYASGTTSYSTILRNKCALVKFNVTTPSSAPICLIGMNNQVMVNFATNEFTYSQINGGTINLAGKSGDDVEKWAILFPQDALGVGTEGSTYSIDGAYYGTRPAIPAIADNNYLPNGIDVLINTYCLPTGAIKGLFSVSANKQVYFSQGNLQYNPKFKLWQFAYPQNTMLHTGWTGSSDVSGEYTSSYNGWIDLFGWATSGTNHGAICHQPYSTDQTDSKYYAYGNASYNLYDRSGGADWGCNPISNGGDDVFLWRTLSSSEWSYVLLSRTTPSGLRFAKGYVDGIRGLIILPDHWDSSTYTLSNTNSNTSSYSNTITADDWTNIFEVNGAVFLPASGWRDNMNVIQNYDYCGYYWASDCLYIQNYSNNNPYCLRITTKNLSTMTYNRHYGLSVRLVQDREQ